MKSLHVFFSEEMQNVAKEYSLPHKLQFPFML